MRLLDTRTFQLEEFASAPDYAILHRWLSGRKGEEITFKILEKSGSTILSDAASTPPGSKHGASAEKIRGACAVARQQDLRYIWCDNICIDKSSSEELRRALNSMFTWYHEAAICYTYLSDVAFSGSGDDMFQSIHQDRQRDRQASEWFDRGWTLQELLAPQKMEFYDRAWNLMGSKNGLAGLVGQIAGIKPEYLLSDDDSRYLSFREASVAARMSWMAGRTTSAVEDIAYSLLGIFNVNMIPQYGEGVKACSRLQ